MPLTETWTLVFKDADGNGLWNTFKEELQDYMQAYWVFSPVNGFAVTQPDEAACPRTLKDQSSGRANRSASWRSSNEQPSTAAVAPQAPVTTLQWFHNGKITGGRQGVNFMIMSAAINRINVYLEAFGVNIMQCMAKRIIELFNQGPETRSKYMFDWDQMVHMAITEGATKITDGHFKVAIQLALNASALDAKLEAYFAKKLSHGARPTVSSLLTMAEDLFLFGDGALAARESRKEQARENKGRTCPRPRPSDAMKTRAMEAIKSRDIIIRKTNLTSAARDRCITMKWWVHIKSYEALDKLSRLNYGMRCILDHGDPTETINATLDKGNMKFTADDFEASNVKGRQPLASERYLEAPQKAADYFNDLYRRLLPEKYKLQVTYDDFVTYAYATKSISYSLVPLPSGWGR